VPLFPWDVFLAPCILGVHFSSDVFLAPCI
jgi:hypothetical protein